MNWLPSAAQGALWGAVCGLVKYWLLWRPLFRPLDTDTASLIIGLHVALSHLFNLVSLVALFLLRSRLAAPWEAALIAAAVALSLAGRVPIFVRAARQRRNSPPDASLSDRGGLTAAVIETNPQEGIE